MFSIDLCIYHINMKDIRYELTVSSYQCDVIHIYIIIYHYVS